MTDIIILQDSSDIGRLPIKELVILVHGHKVLLAPKEKNLFFSALTLILNENGIIKEAGVLPQERDNLLNLLVKTTHRSPFPLAQRVSDRQKTNAKVPHLLRAWRYRNPTLHRERLPQREYYLGLTFPL